MFDAAGIPIIRMGLNPTEDLSGGVADHLFFFFRLTGRGQNHRQFTGDRVIQQFRGAGMVGKINDDVRLSGERGKGGQAVLSRAVHSSGTADPSSVKTVTDSTLVHFRRLDADEIDHYVDKYRPYDKAGSYGVQEWIGYVAIDHIEGSFYNVMGLPVHAVYEEIKNRMK